MFKIILILIIIAISILSLYDDCTFINSTGNTSANTSANVDCCLLLTMYIGHNEEKRKLYEDRVQKWLNKTQFHVYTVESSGTLLDIQHERLHQFTFDQNEDILSHNFNTTILERNSILKAYEYYQEQWKQYKHVFKITGKYYIPSLESLTSQIPEDADVIFQYRGGLLYPKGNLLQQNTEIVGYKVPVLQKLNVQITNVGTYEMQIRKLQKQNKFKAYRLPPLPLNDFAERANGTILKYL